MGYALRYESPFSNGIVIERDGRIIATAASRWFGWGRELLLQDRPYRFEVWGIWTPCAELRDPDGAECSMTTRWWSRIRDLSCGGEAYTMARASWLGLSWEVGGGDGILARIEREGWFARGLILTGGEVPQTLAIFALLLADMESRRYRQANH
jgi:hypothetical protein